MVLPAALGACAPAMGRARGAPRRPSASAGPSRVPHLQGPGRSATAIKAAASCASPMARARAMPARGSAVASQGASVRAGRLAFLRGGAAGISANRNLPFAGKRRNAPEPAYFHAAATWKGNRLVVMAVASEEATPMSDDELKELLARELPQNDQVVRGSLPNGMKYVIMPNSTPPQRFEAHLEVHAGSVDEEDHEQGIAHIVEHVTFLGSKKREQLLGTGSRSNAYTDFHHTVFHMHSPVRNASTGQPMLPQVLEALNEIAFKPQFLPARVEKERRAVLAEAQMMNTIEYRVDCQLLAYLHLENALGKRFPIGLEEQIKEWDGTTMRRFHAKWYFPANTTLYVVGDFEGWTSVEGVRSLIESAFGPVPSPPVIPAGADPLEVASQVADDANPPRARHEVRPPVQHVWGSGPVTAPPPMPSMFKHELLQQFSLSLFCKLPVLPMTDLSDMRRAFMSRVVVSVLQFRIGTRYTEGNPPFIAIDLDNSDSGREGCMVLTLTITSEPATWQGAIQVTMEEVRRLRDHGVSPGELERYSAALCRDSEQICEQRFSVPSVDQLDFVMESDALTHAVMDPKDQHELQMQIFETVTLEETNKIAFSMLSYVCDYGLAVQAGEGWQQAMYGEQYGEAVPDWEHLGPTHATAVVACVPKRMTIEETQEVVDFDITEEELVEALAAEGIVTEAPEDIKVPTSLLTDEEVAGLMDKWKPEFVPLAGPGAEGPARPPPDPQTGVVQRRLSNGIKVNYKKTSNEPCGAMMRLVGAGGRAMEPAEPGPAGAASVCIGARTLSESGTVGDFERAQVEMFCVTHLINCVLEADEEFTVMDFHWAVGNGGTRATFELLHLILEKPRWEQASLERAKQLYLSHYRGLPKSLERATADKLMTALLGNDRRFLDPNVSEIEALTVDGVMQAVMEQWDSSNLEINIAGDFEPEELDDFLLKYVGTVTPGQRPCLEGRVRVSPPAEQREIVIHESTPAERRIQTLFLKDSDERACAYLAGRAPNRWPAASERDMQEAVKAATAGMVGPAAIAAAANAARKAHPLYMNVALGLLMEVINGRLFTTVRDALGLTYDVSFDLSFFDRLPTGWYVVSVTSTPQKIDDALKASLRTLRSLRTNRINQRELERARRTLITRHESDLKDDQYWLALLTHLQSDAVPAKEVNAVRDLRLMYEGATIDDVYEVYEGLQLDDDAIFTCTGQAGGLPPSEDGLVSGAAMGRGRGGSLIPSSNIDADAGPIPMPVAVGGEGSAPRPLMPEGAGAGESAAMQGALEMLAGAMKAAAAAAAKMEGGIKQDEAPGQK